MLQLSFSSRKSNLECGAQGDINHQLEASQSNCSERREL